MSDIDRITDRADKIARIIMDQLAVDGCANLENIRNALLAPLIQAHAVDVEMAKVVVPQKPAKDIPVSIDEFARECVSEYESIVKPTLQGWWGEVEVSGIRPQIFHFKAEATNTGLSAEAMTHRNEAIAKARATGKPQTVSIDLDLWAMPDGRVVSGYEAMTEGDNAKDALPGQWIPMPAWEAGMKKARQAGISEEARQKAKILAPILDPLRESGY